MMRDARVRRSPRGLLFGVFATCTLWLLVQNALLTMWAISHHTLPGWAAVAVLVRAAVTWIAPLWAIACAALLGWAFAASLLGGWRQGDWDGQEGGHHGRAR